MTETTPTPQVSGQIVQELPLEDVHTYLLVRDRMAGEDPNLESLVTSIREIGLSNPIRVQQRPDGTGFELIQGLRRLMAYRQLNRQDGQGEWSCIPALVAPGQADMPALYRQMVDENVIRSDLSFAEMARMAQTYAADPETSANDLPEAVAVLFRSAPYSKRSYIRSFAYLIDRIGPCLAYPAEVPRALGVTLARAIRERPELVGHIRRDLADWDGRSVRDELDVLRRYAATDELDEEIGVAPARKKPARPGQGAGTRITFHMPSAAGPVRCTASAGRFEIRLDRDFPAIDRARLEQAAASLIAALG
ncbi:MAG: ParB N-terminal domain-containing protein [Silicimonas sp.]|nr:ParB N-terminal domain-containing protein [Silicimonas sp.]